MKNVVTIKRKIANIAIHNTVKTIYKNIYMIKLMFKMIKIIFKQFKNNRIKFITKIDV